MMMATVEFAAEVQPNRSKVYTDAMSASDARHHDDVGEEDRPAVDPADLRAHRACRPGERRARIGVREVEVAVSEGDEQNRDERHEQNGGRVRAHAADGDDEPQRRRQAVGRRRRRDCDHDVRDVADGTGLETLGARGARIRRRSFGASRYRSTLHRTLPRRSVGVA
jgi:hypothetical protein